jgi:NMD protein affecting ribosome stability and mRNA decay
MLFRPTCVTCGQQLDPVLDDESTICEECFREHHSSVWETEMEETFASVQVISDSTCAIVDGG